MDVIIYGHLLGTTTVFSLLAGQFGGYWTRRFVWIVALRQRQQRQRTRLWPEEEVEKEERIISEIGLGIYLWLHQHSTSETRDKWQLQSDGADGLDYDGETELS